MLDNVINVFGKLAEYWLLIVLISSIGIVYYFLRDYISIETVSYTHLTLPTSDLV